MSIIATFYACDDANCQKVFAVRSDQENDEFEETWANGLICDFCPECRHKTENIERLESEAKVFNQELETVNL